MNVMPAPCNVLASLSDGGFQHLLAGARASVGIKEGRYMFEAKILEMRTPAEPPQRWPKGGSQAPKQLLRLGFSTSGSSLLIGGDAESACFDTEGSFVFNGKKTMNVA